MSEFPFQSAVSNPTKIYTILRSAINRVKNLTPWLLTTGDDEGVIKVTYLFAISQSSESFIFNSYGIHARRRSSGRTLIILIISVIFYGWRIRNS